MTERGIDMTHKKKKAPEGSGERVEAEAYWKQSDREDRIAWWIETGKYALASLIASLVASVISTLLIIAMS